MFNGMLPHTRTHTCCLVLAGYSRTINAGLRAALADDSISAFVLLNSDTEVVSRSWLPTMMAAANSNPQIGIVGPLSNAASYQSVPTVFGPIVNGRKDWSQNKLADHWTLRAVGRAASRASRGELIDVPVLNGFCLYVKREVVIRVGLMDDVAFPYGFGEENDFCLRTLRLGYEIKVGVDAQNGVRGGAFQRNYCANLSGVSGCP